MEMYIDKKQRPSKVSEYNYGMIEENGLESYDKPVFANIEYKNGNVVYEDYSKLDDYLLKKFIPKYIRKKINKSINNKDNKLTKPYFSIQLKELVKLKLCEKEMKHAIDFIKKQGIHIGGLSQAIDGEYNNYDYITTHQTMKYENPLPWELMRQKFIEYYNTKNSKLRQELIEMNMKLVPYVTWRIAKYHNIDRSELDSYGYEGLINAVDKYDPTIGAKFASYAIPYIRGCVLKHIPKIKNFNIRNSNQLFFMFDKVRRIIENENGQTLEENPKIFDEIIEVIEIYYDIRISDELKKELYFQALEKKSLDEFKEENDIISNKYSEESILSKIEFEDLANIINKMLSILNEREYFVIIELYGINDDQPKTLNEISQKLNISAVRVSQIKNKALRKIRRRFMKQNINLNGIIKKEKIMDNIEDILSKYNYTTSGDYISSDHKTFKK